MGLKQSSNNTHARMNNRFLAECERERLHLSGHIQAHGALLVIDSDLRITHRSANLGSFLDDSELCIGARLPAPLKDYVATLGPQSAARVAVMNALAWKNQPLDLIVTRSNDAATLLELIRAGHDDNGWVASSAKIIEQPRGLEELMAAKQALVQRVFDLSGFRRVMYYRFLSDGDGQVLAEAHDPEVYGSYLGLRFPASDIPQIARTLYLQNPWRMIPDAHAPAIPLEGREETPDLSRSDLRSVSAVHQVYLANMGVIASLSFPVVVAGQLHGLVACHHHKRCQLPLALLESLSQEVRTFNLSLTSFAASNRIMLVDGLKRRFSSIREEVERTGGLEYAWHTFAPALADEFGCEGVQLQVGEMNLNWGEGLERNAFGSLDRWFCNHITEALWLSDSLRRDTPDFPNSRIAGVLAIKVRCSDGRMLRAYFTRQEHIHEVSWGGNPDKPVEFHDGTLGIAPRQSFERWVEKRLGHCRPWESETRLLGLRLREMLLDVANRH